ncbi:hypothetical protein FQZ97_651050 [compost metagenome]
MVVTRRTAVARKVEAIQSGGNTPMPGCGLSLGRWNMLRISELASAGTREAIIGGTAGTACAGLRELSGAGAASRT